MTAANIQPTEQGPDDSEEPSFAGYPLGCPLNESVHADCVAFRITLNDPPTEADFRSHHEMGFEPRPKTTQRQLCRYRSLSVYLTIDDARQHIKKYPLHFGKGHIAAGRLSRRMGKTLLTPSPDRPTHTEWWCADGVDPLACFKVVA